MSTNKENKSHASRPARLLCALLAVMLILGCFSAVAYGIWGSGSPQSTSVTGDVSLEQMGAPLFLPRTNTDSGMAAYRATATVTGGTVNIRSGPSAKYAVLGTVRKGAVVTVVGKFANNWYKMEFKGGYGYITGQYLGNFQITADSGTDKNMTAVSGTAVVKENLNVRTGPDITYQKLGVLAQKKTVVLLGKFPNNWYKIEYGTGAGYVCGDYLAVSQQTTSSPTTKPTTIPSTTQAPSLDDGMTAVEGKGTVTEALNVRKGPATSYGRLTVLEKGTTVTLVGKFPNGWYKIKYSGNDGYVCGDYLKISSATTKPTTAPTTTTTTAPPSIDDGITAMEGKGTVTEALNVRKGPATSYGRLTVLEKGTTVTLVGKFPNGWYKIKYSGNDGYVCGDYLKITQTTTTTKVDDTVQIMDRYGITTERLNIRTGPGITYTIITVAPKGVKLHITGKTANGWYQIAYDNRQAYVSSDYIKLEEETPSTTAQPATTTQAPATTTQPPVFEDEGMLAASGTAVVTANLNVRSGPSVSYDIIGKLASDTTVALLGRFRTGSTYWYKIKFNGAAGYISGDYMKAFNIKLDASGSKAQAGELRGVWLSYIELNFATGYDNEKICKTKINQMFDKAAADGMNAVFVHVRPFSDAYYQSDYFPWSAYVTGTQGKIPTFDPLQIMIDEAHKRGLELHAWINPYRISTSGTSISKLAANNPARQWLEKNGNDTRVIKWGNGLYYNPASEDVRRLIVNGVEEIVRKYDVDGIHFDDYFYPTTDASIDAADYQKYKSSGGKMTLKQWRTDNVSRMVKSCYDVVKKTDASVAFGISPQGNIQNNTDELYADVYQWGSQSGYVDYLAPQIYFGFNHWLAAFDKWTDDWIDLVSHPNVKLYIGLGAYRIGTNQGGLPGQQQEWIKNTDNLKRQLEYMRWTGGCDGFILFSYNSLWGSDVNSYSAEELKNFLSVL